MKGKSIAVTISILGNTLAFKGKVAKAHRRKGQVKIVVPALNVSQVVNAGLVASLLILDRPYRWTA